MKKKKSKKKVPVKRKGKKKKEEKENKYDIEECDWETCPLSMCVDEELLKPNTA